MKEHCGFDKGVHVVTCGSESGETEKWLHEGVMQGSEEKEGLGGKGLSGIWNSSFQGGWYA